MEIKDKYLKWILFFLLSTFLLALQKSNHFATLPHSVAVHTTAKFLFIYAMQTPHRHPHHHHFMPAL